MFCWGEARTSGAAARSFRLAVCVSAAAAGTSGTPIWANPIASTRQARTQAAPRASACASSRARRRAGLAPFTLSTCTAPAWRRLGARQHDHKLNGPSLKAPRPRQHRRRRRRRTARRWLSSAQLQDTQGTEKRHGRQTRSHPRGQAAAVHRRGVPGVAARRARGLHLRRAGQGRHQASGLPQRRGLGRQALRRAARPQDQGRADRADRHRLGRLHAQVLQGRALARGRDRAARRHRRLGAHHLRLDGPQPRLQGGLPQHARRQRRVLRQVRRQRARLAQARPGGRALSQPRAGQSADRPQQAASSR